MAHFNKEKALETIKSGDMDDIQALLDDLEERLNTKKYGLIWEHGGDDEDSAFEPEYIVLDYARSIPCPKLRKDLSLLPYNEYNGNMLLEGDNYIWLKLLEQTHAGKIDVVYIDPPYGTGKKDFKYNDCFVDVNDTYRHSKWLDFMSKRLVIAKNLLTEDGVIFISCDDHEQAPLKMLCDEIFGRQNFIGQIIWTKSVAKNMSKTVSNLHEYITCYAVNKSAVENNPHYFSVRKDGYDEAQAIAAKMRAIPGTTPEDVEKALFKLRKQHPEWKWLANHLHVDENLEIYKATNPSAPTAAGTGKNSFDILHPITGKPCKKPARGWVFNEEQCADMIKSGKLVFGKDENKQPEVKVMLTELRFETQKALVNDSTSGKKQLDDIFGVAPFNNAKPTSIIKWLLQSFGQNFTVLDFFAGSGTTAHAIEEMNAEDGGHRQWILITNNEDQDEDDNDPETGICRDITKPRIDTVITGICPDGSKYSDGTNSGYQYFQYDFMPRYESREANQRAFFTPTKNVDAIVRIKYGVVLKDLDRERMAMTYESDDKQVIVFIKEVDEDLIDEFFDDEHEQHIVLANDIVDVDGVESDTIHSIIPSYEFFM